MYVQGNAGMHQCFSEGGLIGRGPAYRALLKAGGSSSMCEIIKRDKAKHSFLQETR
jgi:hypothetical protein